MEERNYVIRYKSWEAYNATSEKEAIEMFRRDYPNEEILEVES